MLSFVRPLGDSVCAALRDLARRPALLAGLLVVLNAIFIPYLGIVHDAQIYYGLVSNRLEPDLLSSDLFFQFGSQSQYTLFAPLMVPLVLAFGMKGAFFVGYVISITFFLAALVRLVTRLWPDSPAAIAGLVFLAVIQVSYGGHVALHVIEPFLSARLPACALTVWAFAELLDRRWMRGGLSLAAAFAIHPLMTLPGLLLIAFVAIARRWSGWAALGAGLAFIAAFGGIVAYRPLAIRLFGYFDSEWLALTQQTNGYQFPQDWFPEQWFWNLFALTGLLAAAWWARREHADRGRVLATAAIVGAVGLFGSLLFTQLPYALLLKGQAYRWLWLPLLLTPPALLDLAWNAWRTGELKYRLGTVTILLGLGMTHFVLLEIALVFAFAPVLFYGMVVFAKNATWTDKISWTLVGGAVIGFAIWGCYRFWIFIWLCADVRDLMPVHHQMEVIFASLGPGILFPMLLIVIGVFGSRLFGRGRAAQFALAGIGLHLSLYLWTTSDTFRQEGRQGEELRFVEKFLDEKRAELGRSVGIYSDYGKLGQCWVEWRARSFYDCFQVAGFVFNKNTAIEGKRRALVAAPFEAASLAKARWDIIPDGCKTQLEGWLEIDVEGNNGPSEDDLLRLAGREETVDFIVLFNAHFDDLACARHGDVSIYDCRQLRDTRIAAR